MASICRSARQPTEGISVAVETVAVETEAVGTKAVETSEVAAEENSVAEAVAVVSVEDVEIKVHAFLGLDGQSIPAPDARVEKTENAVAKTLAVERQKTPSQARYPQRPGYGEAGKPVTLYANYLPLEVSSKSLFRYHVDIAADAGGRQPVGKKARQIVRLLLEEHFLQQKAGIATDYRSTIISCTELPQTEQYDVRYKDDIEGDYPENPKVYQVTCQYTGQLDPADLVNYLTSTKAGAMLESKAEIVHILNLLMGHYPKTDSSVVSVGANKHYGLHPGSIDRGSLGAGLEVLRGFFISARAATARVLLNIQVKYLACYQEGPLAMVIGEFQRENTRNIYRLEAFLKRLRVRITHITRKTSSGKPRPRVKAIASLATRADGASSPNPPKITRHGAGPRDVQFFKAAPESQPAQGTESKGKKGKKGKKAPPKAGPPQAGRYISVEEFFKTEYNRALDPNMPVVNVGTREKPVYLPVEVCEVEAGQPVGTKLNASQTANMLAFAVRGRKPAENAQSIVTKGVDLLGLGEPLNKTLSTFGVQPSTELITVHGRVLGAPKIYYKDTKLAQKAVIAMFGSWSMRQIRFTRPVTMKSWTWLYIDAPGARNLWPSPNALNESLMELTNNLRDLGIAADSSKPGTRIQLTGNNDAAAIESAVRNLQEKHQPSLILGILYGKDIALYNCIKQVCDVRCGVRNVNVLAEKFRGANDQYCANVGLKINLKLGGVNQSLNTSDLSFISEGRTMLVGIDVTHPSPGSSSSAPSVAGVVASVDSSLAQWPAEIRIQTARQEMVADLDTLLRSRLQHWARCNENRFPENIVVYRDGVSEGQYDIVLDRELPQLKSACAALYPAKDTARGLPHLAIVVVGKRHNTRFYPTRDADSDRSANPSPGTVVDRGISEARHWDFFLQAHAAMQGTARPAHYFTVWDEIFHPRYPGSAGVPGAADVLQDLTHKLCYLFGRATKAVSVCPPAYYADLVCTRARCYLSGFFDPTPAATPAGSVVGSAGDASAAANSSDVEIHPNVRDSMFYI
ncbi:hypothetical protein NUU61_000236 [Penicillium alfredii]|uniref:Piwi domain-containing protein n=1 Tax=Penicillium alfredii TaxID=1506179 RepID=A0A9W9G9I3_9EURO|nr:uncharacterized protein NUU61_000236 [Penicillium alfredii]KAJ5114477.1 hypothetical protein NUU61_000236 [Penicillium alfredii]